MRDSMKRMRPCMGRSAIGIALRNERIDHIYVYEMQGTGKNKTQRLVIYYRFVGYLDIDPTQCHPNYTAVIREGVAVEHVSGEPSESARGLRDEDGEPVEDKQEKSRRHLPATYRGKKVDVTEIRYIHPIWLRGMDLNQ